MSRKAKLLILAAGLGVSAALGATTWALTQPALGPYGAALVTFLTAGGTMLVVLSAEEMWS